MLLRTLLIPAVCIATVAPAQAWEFALRNDNGLYYGELVGFDETGAIRVSATCIRSPRLETDVRIDALAPVVDGGAVPVVADIAEDGSRPESIEGVGQPFNSFAVPSTPMEDGRTFLEELSSANSSVTIDWSNGEAVFDAFDAGPAVKGFRTVCSSIPISRASIGER